MKQAAAPKRRIRQNIWGNWKGYLGTKRVEDFGTDERAAKDWLDNKPEPPKSTDHTYFKRWNF